MFQPALSKEVLQALPFVTLVRQICGQTNMVRITRDAILLLQAQSEEYLEDIFKEAQKIATFCKRTKVTARDMRIARRNLECL